MSMTPEERITNMTKAINQAIKVMGDRFGSTEEDVARAIQGLKASRPPCRRPRRRSRCQSAAPHRLRVSVKLHPANGLVGVRAPGGSRDSNGFRRWAHRCHLYSLLSAGTSHPTD